MLEDMYAGASLPPGLPAPLPPDWEKTATPSDDSTVPFFHLYACVTDGINRHARARGWVPYEAMFFDCAVAGFFDEYRKWPGIPTLAYLELFRDTWFRALRTVGHAYLHVAYDLPRVLVQDMDAAEDMEQAIARRFPSTPTGNVTIRFLDLQHVMTEALARAQRDPEVFGIFAYALRLLPGRSRFVQVFGNWVLALRSNAFLYAESIARLPASQRPPDQIRFRQIYDAAHEVTKKHSRNPLAWFGADGFKTWPAAAMVPLALFAQLEPVSLPTALGSPVGGALVILLIVAAGIGSVWVLDRWFARLAGELGEAIHSALRRGSDDNDNTANRELAGAR